MRRECPPRVTLWPSPHQSSFRFPSESNGRWTVCFRLLASPASPAFRSSRAAST